MDKYTHIIINDIPMSEYTTPRRRCRHCQKMITSGRASRVFGVIRPKDDIYDEWYHDLCFTIRNT